MIKWVLFNFNRNVPELILLLHSKIQLKTLTNIKKSQQLRLDGRRDNCWISR
jgi:hypothetical protein